MWPGNGHISACPEPQHYVIPEPVESQEHLPYLVPLYLSEIFTHNRAANRSFKGLVATGCNCSHNQSRLVLSGCSCSCRELGCPQTAHSLVVPKKGKKPDWTRLLNTILAHPTTQDNCCHHPHPCAPHPILALILTCSTTQQQQWPCCLCMTILLSLSPLTSCLLVLSLSCPHTSDNMTTIMTLPLHNNIVISIPSISLPSPSPSSSCIQQCDNSNMQGQWQQWCCCPCMTMLLSSSSSALAPCSYPAGILPAVGTSMGL